MLKLFDKADIVNEINLLNNKGNIISETSRENALLTAVNKKYQLAILDDGLQQKNINYDYKRTST
mgnify:CR=1 FL=1